MVDIDKLTKRFITQSVIITVVLWIIGFVVTQFVPAADSQLALLVSAVFSLVFAVADGLLWRFAAKKGAEALTTFYTAVSGFRLLLALATMFVYYLSVGSDSMLVFFLVFMVFYFVHLAHHTLFFSRVSNRS